MKRPPGNTVDWTSSSDNVSAALWSGISSANKIPLTLVASGDVVIL